MAVIINNNNNCHLNRFEYPFILLPTSFALFFNDGRYTASQRPAVSLDFRYILLHPTTSLLEKERERERERGKSIFFLYPFLWYFQLLTLSRVRQFG